MQVSGFSPSLSNKPATISSMFFCAGIRNCSVKIYSCFNVSKTRAATASLFITISRSINSPFCSAVTFSTLKNPLNKVLGSFTLICSGENKNLIIIFYLYEIIIFDFPPAQAQSLVRSPIFMCEIYYETDQVCLWYDQAEKLGGGIWYGTLESKAYREAFLKCNQLI